MNAVPPETRPHIQHEDTSREPRISAAFLVTFDVRKGYTIAWQQAKNGLQLDSVVDYKSLPSGLHKVEEDMVYFMHEDQAGISAFLNQQGSREERNARMLAVGVLVPRGHGRMGKCWRHAKGLKGLARRVVDQPEDYSPLEQYWDENRLPDESHEIGSPLDSPVDSRSVLQGGAASDSYRSSRRVSITTLMPSSDHSLSDHHPALSLPKMLGLFGPLLFPLYRAALLRKRILFVSDAPVEIPCNFVYNVSVISTAPKALLDILPTDEIPDLKLHPLFCVGVSDIPELILPKTADKPSMGLPSGWVACTTDDVLATKPELFDLLVMLPSVAMLQTNPAQHPIIVPTSPSLAKAFATRGIRATRRDARRYVNLHAGLGVLRADESEAVDNDDASLRSVASSTLSHRSVVESLGWPLIAYTSLIWWASAGETRDGLTEEEEAEVEQDGQLLDGERHDDPVTTEVAIVAYFHRLTSQIFSVLSDAISRVDQRTSFDSGKLVNEPSEDAVAESTDSLLPAGHGGEQEHLLNGERNKSGQPLERVEVTEDDMRSMGLDLWSTQDRNFVEELVELWWGCKTTVRGGKIDCCGLRIV